MREGLEVENCVVVVEVVVEVKCCGKVEREGREREDGPICFLMPRVRAHRSRIFLFSIILPCLPCKITAAGHSDAFYYGRTEGNRNL